MVVASKKGSNFNYSPCLFKIYKYEYLTNMKMYPSLILRIFFIRVA